MYNKRTNQKLKLIKNPLIDKLIHVVIYVNTWKNIDVSIICNNKVKPWNIIPVSDFFNCCLFVIGR